MFSVKCGGETGYQESVKKMSFPDKMTMTSGDKKRLLPNDKGTLGNFKMEAMLSEKM